MEAGQNGQNGHCAAQHAIQEHKLGLDLALILFQCLEGKIVKEKFEKSKLASCDIAQVSSTIIVVQ